MTDAEPSLPESLRLDKWLWHARVFKTRTLASKVCTSGRVRVNGTPVAKAHHALKPGDVLTLPVGRGIRVLRVRAMGTRRGPAPEARQLYDDLSPPLHDEEPAPGDSTVDIQSAGGVEPMPYRPAGTPPRGLPTTRPPGSGRPTKAERRAVDRLRDRE